MILILILDSNNVKGKLGSFTFILSLIAKHFIVAEDHKQKSTG